MIDQTKREKRASAVYLCEHAVDGEVTVALADGRVVVCVRMPFDLELDDWIELSVFLDPVTFFGALEELCVTGRARAVNRCGELALTATPRGIWIHAAAPALSYEFLFPLSATSLLGLARSLTDGALPRGSEVDGQPAA